MVDESLNVRVLSVGSLLSLKAFRSLHAEIKQFAPDVVQTVLFGCELLAHLIARWLRVPCVISSRRELATWPKWYHRLLQGAANACTDATVDDMPCVL